MIRYVCTCRRVNYSDGAPCPYCGRGKPKDAPLFRGSDKDLIDKRFVPVGWVPPDKRKD